MDGFKNRNVQECQCPHCRDTFSVPASMRGGIANCPHCRKAVDVPGGAEYFFWGLVGLAICFVLGVSGVLASVSGLPAGIAALVVGGAIVAITVACL